MIIIYCFCEFLANMKNVTGFAYSDPGIGKFVILNYINLLGGLILLFLLETKLISRTFQSFFYRTRVDPTSVLNVKMILLKRFFL